MEYLIASAINKMRFMPFQRFNMNVSPYSRVNIEKSQKTVKTQITKARKGLRKIFAQKPDEFVSVSQREDINSRVKKLSKLPKHKRKNKVVIVPKQVKMKSILPFEDETQEILSPLMTKEEEKQWIEIVLRNHDVEWDYKPLEELYRPEIINNGSKQILSAKSVEDAYAKLTEAKTKVYFDELKVDEEYRDKLYWENILHPHNKKGIIINLNNKLLPF